MVAKKNKMSGKKKSVKDPVKVEVEPAPVEPAPLEPAPLVDPPVEVADVVDAVQDMNDLDLITADFSELVAMADTFLTMARSFKTRVAKLEKSVTKYSKVMEKKSRGKKRRVTNPDAPPSGFAKPGPVSDELRKFLSLGKDDLIARTEVTKAINAYCKEHSLQDEADKRKILADSALKKLLKIKKGDELTFFNLQTYLKVHFPNKDGVYPTA